MGDLVAADLALTEANILDPHNPLVWGYLALTQLVGGRIAEAEMALKFAFKVHRPLPLSVFNFPPQVPGFCFLTLRVFLKTSRAETVAFHSRRRSRRRPLSWRSPAATWGAGCTRQQRTY